MSTPQDSESAGAVTAVNSMPNSADATPPFPPPKNERHGDTPPPPDQAGPTTDAETQAEPQRPPLGAPVTNGLDAAPSSAALVQYAPPPAPSLPQDVAASNKTATRRPDPIIISSVLGATGELPEADQMDYFACEEVIEGGWASNVQVGLAFATIRDRRLYRAEFRTFDEYCRERWEYGRRYVDQLISAAQVFTYLRANCSQMKPDHESQIRPLTHLSPEQARIAWDKAVQRASGKTVTARLIKNVVNGVRATLNQNQPPRQKRPSAEAKHRLIDAAVGELLMLLSQKANHAILTQKVEALHSQFRALFPPPPPKRKRGAL